MEGNLSLVVQSGAIRFLKGLRPFFYVEPPSESCFQRVEDVPKYLQKVWNGRREWWGRGRVVSLGQILRGRGGSSGSQSENVHELYASIWTASSINFQKL